MPRKRGRRTGNPEVVNQDCAGIYIGEDVHCVADDPDRCPDPVGSFEAYTRDHGKMASWLLSCGVEKVAVE